MISFIVKRLVSNVVALFIIATVTFFLMKAIPGDPFTEDKALPQEVLDSLYEHYKLNEPIGKQYLSYLHSLSKGDLGPSFKFRGRTVNEIIRSGFPVSLLLGLEALIIALFSGVFLGSLAALYHNKWQDFFSILIAILGISIPSFILAASLQYFLSIKLGFLPVARWGSFEQTILPALSLAALPTAFIARLTRGNMIEVLSMDYIKTARSKGLSISKVIVKHALRNSLTPVLTYLGTLVANIFTGSFIIEKIFGIPGLGQWFINSIANRDYSVIMGLTIFYSILLLFSILLVDIFYGLIDPKVKVGIDET